MSNLPQIVTDAEIQPDSHVGDYELICEIRKTPTVLYGIFLEIVRRFYSDEENMPNRLKGTVWDKDVHKSTMWIDTELKWEDEHPEFRPAIFIALSPIRYTSLTGRSDGKMQTNLKNAETEFSRSGSGSVIISHIGNTDGEGCVLADATLDYVDAFSSVIRDDFCFTKLEVSERVPLVPKQKESSKRWGSTVTLNFEFEDCWTLKLESVRLKKFTLHARQGVMDSVIFK